jgi:hypothetical protein
MTISDIKKASVRWLNYMSRMRKEPVTALRMNAMAYVTEVCDYATPGKFLEWYEGNFGQRLNRRTCVELFDELHRRLRVLIRTPLGYLPIFREEGEPRFVAYVDNIPFGSGAFYIEPSEELVAAITKFCHDSHIPVRVAQLRINGTWAGDVPEWAFGYHDVSPHNPPRTLQEPPNRPMSDIGIDRL